MARYTIRLNDALDRKLKAYMKEKNIELRSSGIKQCIEDATNREVEKSYIYEVDRKLNTILHRLNLNRILLEQLFANFCFENNIDASKDLLLKKMYKEYSEKYFGRLVD